MSAKSFRRDRTCICHMPKCICKKWAARLDKEGLGELERYDTEGNILLNDRGSGKLRDQDRARRRREAEEAVVYRKTLLAEHAFRTERDREIYALYATGMGSVTISKHLASSKIKGGNSAWAVQRCIEKIETQYRATQALATTDEQIALIIDSCDPTTAVLFFSLLRRAVEQPDDIRAFLERADNIPALRGLIEPEEQGSIEHLLDGTDHGEEE